MMKTCNFCKEEFELTDDNLRFYKDKGLHEPNKCPTCRRLKRFGWNIECKKCKKKFVIDGIELIRHMNKHNRMPDKCVEGCK
jgi:hypothetical protein